MDKIKEIKDIQKAKDEIFRQAKQEIEYELFREAVEKEKEKLRAVKWWHKYIPYKIILIRR